MKLNAKKMASITNEWRQLNYNYKSKNIFCAKTQSKLFEKSPDSKFYEYVPCPLCMESNYSILYDETQFGIYKANSGYHATRWKSKLITAAVKIIGNWNTSKFLSILARKPINTEKLKKKKKWDGYSVVRCTGCGFLYRNPIYTPKMVEEAYNKNYLGFLTGKYGESRTKNYARVLSELQFERKTKEFRSKKILDVGCGHGLFLNFIKEHGWEPYGLDFAKDCIEYAQNEFGLTNVAVGNLTSNSFSEGYFDVTTLWSVAAHLEKPIDMFKNINRILKPGGLLLIYTVNAGGIQHKIKLSKWNGLHKNHLVFFDIETLTYALKQAGFTNIEEGIDRRDYDRWCADGTIENEDKESFKTIMENPNKGNMMMVLATK